MPLSACVQPPGQPLGAEGATEWAPSLLFWVGEGFAGTVVRGASAHSWPERLGGRSSSRSGSRGPWGRKMLPSEKAAASPGLSQACADGRAATPGAPGGSPAGPLGWVGSRFGPSCAGRLAPPPRVPQLSGVPWVSRTRGLSAGREGLVRAARPGPWVGTLLLPSPFELTVLVSGSSFSDVLLANELNQRIQEVLCGGPSQGRRRGWPRPRALSPTTALHGSGPPSLLPGTPGHLLCAGFCPGCWQCGLRAHSLCPHGADFLVWGQERRGCGRVSAWRR